MCSHDINFRLIKDWKAVFPVVENAKTKETMQWKDKGSYNGSSYNWHKQNPTFWKQFMSRRPHATNIFCRWRKFNY